MCQNKLLLSCVCGDCAFIASDHFQYDKILEKTVILYDLFFYLENYLKVRKIFYMNGTLNKWISTPKSCIFN